MTEPKEERTIRRAWRIRRILKTCIRLAYYHAHWLTDEDWETAGTSYMQNIRIITSRKKKSSLISVQQKALLSKPGEDRSEEDRRYLSVVFEGMRCFKRYPEETRRRLAEVASFAYFPPGRYILRQGDPPFGWYYILDGQVSVKKGGEFGKRKAQIFDKGYTFGEFDLLHGKPRSSSVISLTHCEFLVIERENFNTIIKDTVMLHFNLITGYMKRLPYFEHYDEEDFMDACLVAKVKEYQHNELILGDDVGYSQFTYFIIQGSVHIIHHLMFTANVDAKTKRIEYKLYDPFADPSNPYFVKKPDFSDVTLSEVDEELEFVWDTPPPVVDYFQLEMVKKLADDIHTCFMRIYKLKQTGCFNIGEHLRHRFTIAETDSACICLLLPRHWLFKRNKWFVWSRIVDFLNKKIPNEQMILNEYVRMRKWELDKKAMVTRLLSKSSRLNTNNINNVPYSLRMKGDLTYSENTYSTFSKLHQTNKR